MIDMNTPYNIIQELIRKNVIIKNTNPKTKKSKSFIQRKQSPLQHKIELLAIILFPQQFDQHQYQFIQTSVSPKNTHFIKYKGIYRTSPR